MRTLKFIVEGQRIRPDPECDFSGIVRGSRGYLAAEFSFDSDWDGCRKAAVFRSLSGECSVPVMGKPCKIPEEVLKRSSFYVKVVGEREGYRITTNSEKVRQT